MNWITALLGGFVLAHATTYVIRKVKESKNPFVKNTIYDISVSLLGKEIYNLINPTVKAADGCASSVSYVLQQSGYAIPKGGMLTVNEIIDWCTKNGKEVSNPQFGDIITAHSPDVANPNWAHCGVVAHTGVMSNTSFPIAGFRAGEWAENYRGDNFQKFFTSKGSIIKCFRIN